MSAAYPTAPTRRRTQPTPWTRGAPGTTLTDREQQVLELTSRGHTNGAIGRKLYVSEDTVKQWQRSLFRRLGAVDRAHAVRRGFELGLLQRDQPVRRVS